MGGGNLVGVLGFCFYFSGVIYLYVYYFENRETSFGITLIFAYIISLLFWHLFLKRKFKLRVQLFEVNENAIIVTEAKGNKKYEYKWEDLKSFSTKHSSYPEENPDFSSGPNSAERKKYYIKKDKHGFFPLLVPNKYVDQIYGILNNKLEEIK